MLQAVIFNLNSLQLRLQGKLKDMGEGASSLNMNNSFFNQIKPYIGQILLGTSVGFIAGYTFKKVARSLAILIIALSAILFLLINYTDMINIDFLTIKRIGISAKDMALQHKGTIIHKIKDFSFTNVPFVAGFLIGFYGGLKMASKK